VLQTITDWPAVITELNKGKMTVGKIYAALLILESWRTTRFGRLESAGLPVSEPPKSTSDPVNSEVLIV
jgi:hypothetical protein